MIVSGHLFLACAYPDNWQILPFGVYLENVSGATVERPELLRLLKDAHKDDVLLVEPIDCLSCVRAEDLIYIRSSRSYVDRNRGPHSVVFNRVAPCIRQHQSRLATIWCIPDNFTESDRMPARSARGPGS